MADCLAVAHKYNIDVRVFSSALNTLVYGIRPSSGTGTTEEMISTAYLAVCNESHFDATVPATENVLSA